MFRRTLDFLGKVTEASRAASGVNPCRRRVRPQVEFLEDRSLLSNYTTSFGGSLNDVAADIAVDAAGNAYVVGQTVSPDFPTPSGYDRSFNGDTDAFVAKLDPTGKLVWASYLGGTGNDRATGVALDTDGNVYVTGNFSALNAGDSFPTTPGAFLTSPTAQDYQTWAAKFNGATGSLDYSTFLGRGLESTIAVDSSGCAYVAASLANFPTTPGAFQTTSSDSDVAVAKLNPTGTALVYCTFLGGSGSDHVNDIAVDARGNVCLMGATGSLDFPTTSGAFRTTAAGNFVTKLNSTGSALLYSTYLEVGGSRPEYGGMALDGDGNIYVTSNAAPGVPTTTGAFETLHTDYAIVVAKLNPALSGAASLVYSTFIGHGLVRDIAVNSSGEACITGSISFPNGFLDFPTTPGAPFATGAGFLTRLNNAGSAVLFSTPFNRDVIAFALDNSGNAYLASTVSSSSASNDVAVDKLPASDVGPPPALASLTCTDVRALENVPNFYFNVHRWGPTNQTVTVNFTTSDGTATAKSDYVPTSGTLTFAPGEVTKTITVKIKNDGKKEPTETFYVILSGVTNATVQRTGTGAIDNDGDGKGVFTGGGGGTLQLAVSPASALPFTLVSPPTATDLALAAAPVPARLPASGNTDTADRIFSRLTDEGSTTPSRSSTWTAWDAIQDGLLDFPWTEDISLDDRLALGRKTG